MKTLKFDNPKMSLYVKSMGRVFKVTAVCRTDEEANKICQKHSEMAVMACDCNGLVYLAEKYSAICLSSVIVDA